MGMPVIEVKDRCDAITDLIESVALEEAALAHILNAEGEKLQAVIAKRDTDVKELLCVNESVEKMVIAITKLEEVLKAKLALFSDEYCCKKRPHRMECIEKTEYADNHE